MTGMREHVEGSTTVRISGLDAKELSLGSIRFELEGLVADCVSGAADAVDTWRGRRAETFVEEVNPFLRRLARLVQKVGQGKLAVAAWPEVPVRDPLEELAVSSAGVAVPAAAGTSAANPAKLDVLADRCLAVHERVRPLTAGVGLDDVTAEVVRPPLDPPYLLLSAQWPNETPPDDSWRGPVLVEPEPALETVSSNPAIYVDVPDVSDLVAGLVETSGHLGAFVAGVALAFREYGGDGLMSRQDVETFLEFKQLAVVEQAFDSFDSAADPDRPANGAISVADLEAVAGGDGQVALAAAWLLAHKGPLTRLRGYEQARDGFSFGPLDDRPITARSVLQLTVDQHVYADDPARSGEFVDRNFESLMSREVGQVASDPAMAALFDSALTGSDQRGDLMQRVIAEVADDGTIHNGGLPLAFANGAAANMSVIDANINDAFPTAEAPAPEGAAETYGDTHDFLREVSRDPAAANRLREGLNDYGRAEVAAAAHGGDERTSRLRGLGRVQNTVNVAQNEALTTAAEDEIRVALEQPGTGLTPGRTLDYHISTVPLVGVGDLASSANDLAGALGISAGDVLDTVLDSPTERDPLAGLDEAERIDRARRAETAANQAIWVAEARFENPDEALLDAAAGQPFLEANGMLKTDPSQEEVHAFRDWAITQSRDGGILLADVQHLQSGVGHGHLTGRDPSAEGGT